MAKLTTEELLAAFEELTLIELSEFIKAFEEKFDVTIPDEEVKNLKTVEDAVNFIDNAQA